MSATKNDILTWCRNGEPSIWFSGTPSDPETWPEQNPVKAGCYRDAANSSPIMVLRPWQLGAILAVVSAAFFALGIWVMR